MRLIIEARLEGEQVSARTTDGTIVAVVERQDCSVSDLGLTLAEGRALLAEIQTVLVSHQAIDWLASHLACSGCGSILAHKGSRSIVMRTVFGKINVRSPRFWVCRCTAGQEDSHRTVSPLRKAIRNRVTPELNYLQAKWAAHLPYRQATELHRKVLLVDNAISMSSTRRRVLAIGKALDAQIELEIAETPKVLDDDQVCESTSVGSVSVDSAWLSFSSSPKSRNAALDLAELQSPLAMKPVQARHVNIVAGRPTFADQTSRLYAYVHKQVPSTAARLD